MITKILFTLTIIIGTLIFFKKQRARQTARAPLKMVMTENQKMFRQGAYLFLGLMLLSALVVFLMRFGDDQETMQVRVINSQTGESTSYLAQQKEIRPRSFTTLQGRKVYIADVERIEVEAVEP